MYYHHLILKIILNFLKNLIKKTKHLNKHTKPSFVAQLYG